MLTEREVFFTEEGLQKAEDELEQLKSVERRKVADNIKEALAYGDISENAEYDHAKNEQARLEEKISKLEQQIGNAVIIEENTSKDIVNVGSGVIIQEAGSDYTEEYKIVGSAETDPLKGKISNESPMGEALLGKKVGEIVPVSTPDGIVDFEVIEIN